MEPEEWYYVVVKNQEGSTGKYRLRIDTPNFAITDQGLVPPRFGGSDSVQVVGLGQDDEALRYFAIQLPDYHNGTLVVTSQNGQGAWDFDLFSEAGGKVAGQVVDIPTGFSQLDELTEYWAYINQTVDNLGRG